MWTLCLATLSGALVSLEVNTPGQTESPGQLLHQGQESFLITSSVFLCFTIRSRFEGGQVGIEKRGGKNDGSKIIITSKPLRRHNIIPDFLVIPSHHQPVSFYCL